jgi:hypothetical protein
VVTAGVGVGIPAGGAVRGARGDDDVVLPAAACPETALGPNA